MPLKSLIATNQTQVLLVEPAVWMLTHSSFTAQSATCDAIQDAPVGAQPTVWQISASVLKGAEAWWGKWWQTIGCLRQPRWMIVARTWIIIWWQGSFAGTVGQYGSPFIAPNCSNLADLRQRMLMCWRRWVDPFYWQMDELWSVRRFGYFGFWPWFP